MQHHVRLKFTVLLGVVLALALTGVRCLRGTPPEVAQANKPVTLTWWRVFDDEASVRPITEAYKALHPNVTVVYRKLRFEEYEQELLNALAEDRGPDILSIHNTWVRKYQSKIVPLPPTITLPFSETKGGLRKEVVTTLKTAPSLSLRSLRANFVDAVADGVVIAMPISGGAPEERIFGLPLALDTLALLANRDLLNLAGIPGAPASWPELQSAVKKLTKLNTQGNLLQGGAALGSSRNIERAVDILALLMMQNGAEMINASGVAAFDRVPPLLSGRATAPGLDALTFYTDFANPQKETYTFSATEASSLESFLSGKTAMLFGYSYHVPLIRARSPRLNLMIARAPQIEGNPEINFANYWVEAVSKKSAHPDWAWDFIQFAARAENVKSYLDTVKKPTALRALIGSQLEDEDVGIFAAQLLTAKSWYRGLDAPAAENALLDAVDAVLAGGEPEKALGIAALRVNQTLR